MENFQTETTNSDHSSESIGSESSEESSSISRHSSDDDFLDDSDQSMKSDSSYKPASSGASSASDSCSSSGSKEIDNLIVQIHLKGESTGKIKLIIEKDNSLDIIDNIDISNAQVAFVLLGTYIRNLK